MSFIPYSAAHHSHMLNTLSGILIRNYLPHKVNFINLFIYLFAARRSSQSLGGLWRENKAGNGRTVGAQLQVEKQMLRCAIVILHRSPFTASTSPIRSINDLQTIPKSSTHRSELEEKSQSKNAWAPCQPHCRFWDLPDSLLSFFLEKSWTNSRPLCRCILTPWSPRFCTSAVGARSSPCPSVPVDVSPTDKEGNDWISLTYMRRMGADLDSQGGGVTRRRTELVRQIKVMS